MNKTNLFGEDSTSVYYTKRGRLTDYALSCGYTERKKFGTIDIRLWKENGVYHVRAHDHDTGNRVFWDSTIRLTTARMKFDMAEAICLAYQNSLKKG